MNYCAKLFIQLDLRKIIDQLLSLGNIDLPSVDNCPPSCATSSAAVNMNVKLTSFAVSDVKRSSPSFFSRQI